MKWVEVKPRMLQAMTDECSLGEEDIDPIQRWCNKHNCGKRMAFDMFKFKSQKEITMFLLKWG